MSNKKTYQCKFSCKHFEGAYIIPNVESEIIAEKQLKETLKKKHTANPVFGKTVFRSCTTHCQLKIQTKEQSID